MITVPCSSECEAVDAAQAAFLPVSAQAGELHGTGVGQGAGQGAAGSSGSRAAAPQGSCVCRVLMWMLVRIPQQRHCCAFL